MGEVAVSHGAGQRTTPRGGPSDLAARGTTQLAETSNPLDPSTPVRQLAPPRGHPVALLDLRPGDRAHLPLTSGEPGVLHWSGPVTITSVVLIDTELVQVRWAPQDAADEWAAHLLLLGPAYEAGAIRVP